MNIYWKTKRKKLHSNFFSFIYMRVKSLLFIIFTKLKQIPEFKSHSDSDRLYSKKMGLARFGLH